jgi:hypothetical protein
MLHYNAYLRDVTETVSYFGIPYLVLWAQMIALQF